MRILLPVLALAAGALAETGPGLVGPGPRRSALRADVAHYLDGRTDAGLPFSATVFRLDGTAGVDSGWRLGLAAEHRALDTSDARLPAGLTDVSVAVGRELGAYAGWTLGATLGAGFASDEPFGDSRGAYGIASLSAWRPAERSGATWLVALSYDGNRSFLRDFPLPGIAYVRRVDETLFFIVGIPFSRLVWRPRPYLAITAGGIPPVSGELEVAFSPRRDLALFGRWRSDSGAYHVAGTPRRQRLFYEEHTVAAGARWTPARGRSIEFAAGWAFEREFEVENDSGRELGTIRLTDEPFLLIAASWRF